MVRFRMYPLRANNVLELYQQRSLINLEPAYQRLSVWDEEKQQLFIDSVINGVDIPKLYFHEVLANRTPDRRYKYAVIDGKQRMLALWAFIEGKLRLASNFVFFDNEDVKARGATYEDLLEDFPNLRAKFDNFNVPTTVVQADDDNLIEQLFTRLNVQVYLTGPEKRNALGGPLPYTIRKIASTPFFLESIRIRNNRLQHHDLAAKFLYLTRTNGFNSVNKTALDSFVTNYKKAHEEGQDFASEEAIGRLEESTKAILNLMYGFFDGSDLLLYGVGRTTLYFHLFRIYNNLGTDPNISKKMLEGFNADVIGTRRKSQRMARGSGELFEGIENTLREFDQERQSVNDGPALERQYNYLRTYLMQKLQLTIPEAQ